jgi:hypothetical protein
MKKILVTVLFAMLVLTVAPVLAVKPSGNLAAAEKVPWNLSAEVMRVPPYGSRDIPGSDEASKLIVNQPNGNVEAVITGAMNGLHPNTVYTVYLSKGYAKTIPRCSLEGDWTLQFMYGGSPFIHEMTVTIQQLAGSFEGYGHYVPDPGYTWTVTGTVSGSNVEFTLVYTGKNAGYFVDAVGTIASDGTMEGTWSNPSQSGTWSSTDGQATLLGYVGSGWSGLFTSTAPPFTFTTDEYGAGSWHLNLRNSDFPRPGTYTLSVWINEAGGTMLISDNFEVVVD